MTPHISAKKEDISNKVILSGDPNRTKYISEHYLENARLVSDVRNALFYTGTYKGKSVTVGTSGIGSGSMNIYAFELFNFYGVDSIIRIGTASSYLENVKCGDIILATEAYADHTWVSESNLGKSTHVLRPSEQLNDSIRSSTKKLSKVVKEGRVHTMDLFYDRRTGLERKQDSQSICCEMAAFTLFANAIRANKKAACLLIVVDSLVSKCECLGSDEKFNNVDGAIEISLEAI